MCAAGHDFTFLVDEDEVRDADAGEVRAEGVDPEVIWGKRALVIQFRCSYTLLMNGPE